MTRPKASPLISVVMPFLDPPEMFITEAVISVLSQSFTEWELFMVDDGSAAPAAAVADRLAGLDPERIQTLAHRDGQNHGIAASRNLGLSRCRGEFVAFLDSDDVWYPNKLEEQIAILEASPHVDLLFGRSLYWRSWTGTVGTEADGPPPLRVRDRSEMRAGAFAHKILRAQVMVPCPSSILVRATAARAVGGFEESVSNLYEDQAFYAKIGLAGTVVACSDVWDRYRIHADSVVQSATPHQALSARREFLTWLSHYVDAVGHGDRAFQRTVRLEQWAAQIPRGPKLMRLARRAVALPGRVCAR